MRTFKYILISTLILQSCITNNKTVSIGGNYVSMGPSFFQSLFYSYAIGMKLDIRSDSTFLYETCGNIGNGVWNISGDTLELKLLNYKLKSESSELFKTIIKYRIEKDNELHRSFNAEGGVIHDHLIKCNN